MPLEVAERHGPALGIAPTEVLVASTGVIGRPYPMDAGAGPRSRRCVAPLTGRCAWPRPGRS